MSEERSITAANNIIDNINTDKKNNKNYEKEKGRNTTVWYFNWQMARLHTRIHGPSRE